MFSNFESCLISLNGCKTGFFYGYYGRLKLSCPIDIGIMNLIDERIVFGYRNKLIIKVSLFVNIYLI